MPNSGCHSPSLSPAGSLKLFSSPLKGEDEGGGERRGLTCSQDLITDHKCDKKYLDSERSLVPGKTISKYLLRTLNSSLRT